MSIEQEIAALDRIKARPVGPLGWSKQVVEWGARHREGSRAAWQRRALVMRAQGVYRGA